MFRDQPNEAVALLSVISHGPRIASMKYVSWVFTPTKNRRLNELVGFLMFVSAVLLFLALAMLRMRAALNERKALAIRLNRVPEPARPAGREHQAPARPAVRRGA